MKRFLLLCLFVVGLAVALTSFKGLAARGTYDSIVLDFREDIPQEQVERRLSAIAQEYDLSPRLNSEFSAADNVYIVRGDRALLQKLKKELAKSTEFVEPNYTYGIPPLAEPAETESTGDTPTASVPRSQFAPDDPMYAKQWNLRDINVEGAWSETKGKGVTVAVIDTGVSSVPDLKNTEFVEGYDFVNDRAVATDDNGHGTHVAGTVAQSTNNNYGVAGVAYEAKIMPLKVLSASGSGQISDIAEAIKFAADNGADVINMSLGGGGESALMKEAIEYAHNKGVVIIAAAGNSGQNAAGYPARYARVIGVSATNATGDKTPYSNYGAGVDIAAPGGDTRNGPAGGILQNTIDRRSGNGIFAPLQGTSMASPHVAGVAALVKGVGVEDPNEVTEVLLQSAREVSDDPNNHYGAGHLDAASAVQLAMKGKLSWNHFFRWLRDNGYFNLKFWFDGGVVALLPKVLMVLGSYLLAWLLRTYLPLGSWNLATGLIFGSSGLFVLRGLYIFDLPQWPLRVAGSSLPELGTAVQGSSALNPIFASVLIPAILVVLLLGSQWKWFAIGTSLGVASCLAVSAFFNPALVWLGGGIVASLFLLVNAALCFGLAALSAKPEGA